MTNNNIMVINGSTIEINKPSNRVYLTNLYTYNTDRTVLELDKIAREHNLMKIIARVPSNSKEAFLNNNYKIEAHIPGFFKNEIDVYFMGKFLTKEREICHNKEIIENVLEKALGKIGAAQKCYLEREFYCKKIEDSDVDRLVELYKRTFETYPTPIFDREYVLNTMKEGCDYLGIYKGGQLVATAAAEKDFLAKNAEMSAVAVLPDYRGKNFALWLMEELEKILKKQVIKTSYGIARASSYGMNIAFAKMKYTYVGTLVNNTCIGGNIEHMHVWHKKI